jgi:transcriptional regulator with XRE-family HTH domain
MIEPGGTEGMSFKEIGRKLQLAREEKGMSQEQLARALGCSQSALSNYEKGKRRLYLSHLEKLSQILDKPLEYFMENNRPPVEKEHLLGGDHSGQFLHLINTIYQLSDEQIKEVLSYIEYIKWKEKRGGQ